MKRLFNADTYLQYSSTEKWDVIPANKRDTRDTLVAAANAYLDAFLEQKKDLVPWGYPCNRTEGGMHTGRGNAEISRGVLHFRRRKSKRRQRRARYSSFPRGERQAALRPHAHTSAAGKFPRWTGRPARCSSSTGWRPRSAVVY